MANLVETAQWEAGVYQLETSDPVEGGPDGIDNAQARQLANRTAYLKQQQEAHAVASNPHPQYATLAAMQAAINALVAAAPGALDTLKELADAIGDDPNFATTMTNALALKAALNSPIFTGTPKGPTSSQFDSSTNLATTAFAQGIGLRASGQYVVSATQLLSSSKMGQYLTFNTNGVALTLPAANSVAQGVGFAGKVLPGVTGCSLLTSGSDRFQSTASSSSAYGLSPGDNFLIVSDGVATWSLIIEHTAAGFAALPAFGALLTGNGYQKLPGGLIFQWGYISYVGTGYNDIITLPIAFPNGFLGGAINDAGNGIHSCAIVAATKTTITACGGINATGNPSYAVTSYRFFVVGY
ncbi:hypothetical protein R69746_06960 [Paraburkholderia aspalathi]|uniref:gp53-like domain-containing protein n=1 Tax=Paraburkholderia aspalathi TaxID=1324617 RepID=UPI00190C44E0|nr:hypothetical protein [Paraburkholderia aspalathi]MBK3842954.1 hypothetical protein [Paraburkholderia aspalathi]CAE6841840.1 hypothetical protein R69746_06960 [Paraburkholderia aspalathi]